MFDLQQALDINVDSITTEDGATEAFQTMFYPADEQGALDYLTEDQWESSTPDLINHLAEGAFKADEDGNSTASDILNKMRSLMIKFPNAEFGA